MAIMKKITKPSTVSRDRRSTPKTLRGCFGFIGVPELLPAGAFVAVTGVPELASVVVAGAGVLVGSGLFSVMVGYS